MLRARGSLPLQSSFQHPGQPSSSKCQQRPWVGLKQGRSISRMPTHVGGWTVQMLRHICAQAQCFGLQPYDLQPLSSHSPHMGSSFWGHFSS